MGALEETSRRRAYQLAYNAEHGITPETIVKGVSDIAELLALESPHVPASRRRRGKTEVEGMSREGLERLIVELEEEMLVAAEGLRFQYAAKLRLSVALGCGGFAKEPTRSFGLRTRGRSGPREFSLLGTARDGQRAG